MATIRNVQNGNVFGVKVEGMRNNLNRKPLRGVQRTQSLQVKPSLKEKTINNGKENAKESKPVKSLKTRSDVVKEAFQNVAELKSNLPVIEPCLNNKLPPNVENIDSEDVENPLLVSVYINDIYFYLRSLELMYPIEKFHLRLQPEVTGKMRAILIDWLVQVHLKFHLLQETLYTTVSILDRYLQADRVKRTELQLIGVTSMFIASKYEEIYAPTIADFVYITDNTYNKLEILKMERTMLKSLNFEFSKPLPLHFLRRNSKAGNVDAIVHTLAKYLMEIVLPEYDCAHYRPSLLAAAALYLSLKLLTDSTWTETLQHYSQYSEEDVMPVVRSLCKILLKSESSQLKAVRNKYSSSAFYKISVSSQLKSPVVAELAGARN